MKIVKPSVQLIGLMLPAEFNKNGELCTNHKDCPPEMLIEMAGRTCYKSEDKMTSDSHKRFIGILNEKGHESVLEHSCASFRIVCDRGVSHEIVRHRLVSYSQESTRYCNYSKEKFGNEISVIKPPLPQKPHDSVCVCTECACAENAEIEWKHASENAEASYFQLLAYGCSPQIARAVLPICLKTELIMSCNFREWRHFLRLRTSRAAHPQMREIAWMIADILIKIAPTVFKEFTHNDRQ